MIKSQILWAGKEMPKEIIRGIWCSTYPDKPCPNIRVSFVSKQEFLNVVDQMRALAIKNSSPCHIEKCIIKEYGRLHDMGEARACVLTGRGEYTILIRDDSPLPLEDLKHEFNHIIEIQNGEWNDELIENITLEGVS